MSMTTTKEFCVIAFCACCILVFAGCGSENSPKDKAQNAGKDASARPPVNPPEEATNEEHIMIADSQKKIDDISKPPANPLEEAANKERVMVADFKKKVDSDVAILCSRVERGLVKESFKSPGSWYKRSGPIANIKYDVKKTDSLVNPYVGVLTFECHIKMSGLMPNRQEAEKVTLSDPSLVEILVEVHEHIYHYNPQGGWIFAEGTSSFDGRTCGCSKDAICPQFLE